MTFGSVREFSVRSGKSNAFKFETDSIYQNACQVNSNLRGRQILRNINAVVAGKGRWQQMMAERLRAQVSESDELEFKSCHLVPKAG